MKSLSIHFTEATSRTYCVSRLSAFARFTSAEPPRPQPLRRRLLAVFHHRFCHRRGLRWLTRRNLQPGCRNVFLAGAPGTQPHEVLGKDRASRSQLPSYFPPLCSSVLFSPPCVRLPSPDSSAPVASRAPSSHPCQPLSHIFLSSILTMTTYPDDHYHPLQYPESRRKGAASRRRGRHRGQQQTPGSLPLPPPHCPLRARSIFEAGDLLRLGWSEEPHRQCTYEQHADDPGRTLNLHIL